MSSFGALQIDVERTPITAVMASSNKCLEGVPGLSFAVVEEKALLAAKGNNPSLCFDLYEQWQGSNTTDNGVLPTGPSGGGFGGGARPSGGRGRTVSPPPPLPKNFDILAEGWNSWVFGFSCERQIQAQIIATFFQPFAPWFHFSSFYQALAGRGFLIYPGKLSQADTFRIGCIGAIGRDDFHRFLVAIEAIVEEQKRCVTGTIPSGQRLWSHNH